MGHVRQRVISKNGTTPTFKIQRRAVFDVSQSSLKVEGKRREKPSALVNVKGLKAKRLNVK